MINLALLIFVSGKLLILVRVALLQKRIVISSPAKQPLAANLEDAVHELVNEFAVVGNHQNRAGIILQILLHPNQRLEVEMVRRLIEHQQVRLLHEQAAEMRAHNPATTHLAHGAVVIAIAKAQAGEYALGLGLELRAALFVVQIVLLRLHVFAAQNFPARHEIFRRKRQR